MIASVPFWIFEPIPFSQTALWLLIFFLIFKVVEADVVLSGFSSLALFLTIAGLMIGNAVNETNLGKRLAMWFLMKLGGVKNGVLIGVIIIQQVLSLFVPAASIRTALLIPIIENLLKDMPQQSAINKQVMLCLAYAGNVSTICFLPGGITNVIVVEFINQYTNYQISYGLWFLLMLPLWVLLLPVIYFSVVASIKVEQYPTSLFQCKIRQLKEELPLLERKEKKSLFILALIVILWASQTLHGIHPAFIAIMGALLLASPKIGVIKWDKIIRVNIDVFLIVGATFSIGNILNQSGTADYLAKLITSSYLVQQIDQSWVLIILLTLFVHFYHTLITNTGTASVTLIPIVLSVAPLTSLDPVIAALLTGVTLVFAFIFVIGSLPNLLVQNTKIVSQHDFIFPGVVLTIVSVILTVGLSVIWWPNLI